MARFYFNYSQSRYFCRINLKVIVFFSILISGVSLVVRFYNSSCTFRGYCTINDTLDDSAIQKYYNPGKKSYHVTEKCRIPITPAIPPFFRRNWKRTIQDCSYAKQLAILENETTLRFLPNTPTPCCIQEITRGTTDDESGLTRCEYMNRNAKHVNIGTKEAFMIKCGGFINAEATIPIKPEVQEKLRFWESIPPEERPPSVFIFGFDSVSRAHAYRSLPLSIELMMKLGFVDFRSYHSVLQMTLQNFMAFLMGLPIKEVRESCASDWSTPYDNCPLIWKQYAERKYITSYFEDDLQTFNWGGQGGFNKKPTDYYLHHLFLELGKARVGLLRYILHKRDCPSTETVPEFMLRYTTRFLKRFATIPFFSFTWFNYPFHDDVYALPSYDQHLHRMLQMISSNEDILQNVIIILIGDHGDRVSSFSQKAPESWFERGLPPLFIRLSNGVKKKHPEIVRALSSNSAKLTTPFDVHQTLLHVLNMSSNSGSKVYDYRNRNDRSSVFEVFPVNRTCESTNIPEKVCLCRVKYNQFGENEVTDDFTQHVLTAATQLLNDKIRGSKYSDKCFQFESPIWETRKFNGGGFHRIVGRRGGFVDSIIAFTVSPGGAKFEVRIRTPEKMGASQNVSNFSELVSFTRVNLYDNQSWCVVGDTDADKEMKGLCSCK